MKIGIIVFSQSGNTLYVAKKLEAKMRASGMNVKIERITIVGGKVKANGSYEFDNIPKLSSYNKLVIASPINGFTLAAPMKKFLSKHANLNGKEVACLVTQRFKRAWLGGNQGIRYIKDICQKNSVNIKLSSIVHWSAKDRDKQIEAAVDNLVNIYK